MSHWIDINLVSAALVVLCLLVLMAAIGFATRRMPKSLRKVVIVVAGVVLFANPATEAVWLLPVSARRAGEMLALAQREHLVGQPNTEIRRIFGDPDEVVTRPPGIISDVDGGVLKQFESYTVWWCHTVKLCPLCGDVRVTMGDDGLVDGVTAL